MGKKISLALGSGSAKGWAHIGIIKALKELGYKIEAISGTSAGAIIAAYEAFDLLSEFEEFVLNLDKRRVLRYYDLNFLPVKGLIGGNRLLELFAENLKNRKIEDTKIPLYICASSLESGKCVTFEKGSVIEGVRASISIPGLFTPAEIKGMYFVDGGITNPVPVDILSDKGHRKIIAVDLNSPLQLPFFEESPNVMSTINRSITIMSHHLTSYQLKNSDAWKILRPDLRKFGLFEFYRGKELIEAGYDYTIKSLS